MADNTIGYSEPVSPDKKFASQSFARGVDTVHRKEVCLGDNNTNAAIAAVKNAAPAAARNLPPGG